MRNLIFLFLFIASCSTTNPRIHKYEPNGIKIQNFQNISELNEFTGYRTQNTIDINVLNVISLIQRISIDSNSLNINNWIDFENWLNTYLNNALVNGIHENEPVIPTKNEIFIVREYYLNAVYVLRKEGIPSSHVHLYIHQISRQLIFTIINKSYDSLSILRLNYEVPTFFI